MTRNPPNLALLAETLQQAGVDYVLIGGMAMLLRGWTGGTFDSDLVVSIDSQNLEKLAFAISALNPKTRSGNPISVDKFSFGGAFVTFWTDAGMVQIINRVSGFENYESLRKESSELAHNNLKIRTATLFALRKMKTGTGRKSDEQHLEAIDELEKL